MATQQQLVKQDRGEIEFVPFGAQDKVKLSITIVQRLIAVPTKSGKTCSDTDALRFIALCQAQRLNPFAGDAYLIGYDTKDGPKFNLITAHQAFLKRAETHPEFNGMKSGIIVKNETGCIDEQEGDFYTEDQTVLGGWAKVFFKTREHPMYKRVRMERFRKGFGVWVEDAAGMIVKCSEADALRSAFPTMLGGMYLREEMPVEDPRMVKPVFGQQKQLEPPTDTPPPPKGPCDILRENMTKASITEAEVMSFAQEIGLAEPDDTIGSLHERDDAAVGMLIEQWADISKRIIEARQPQT